MVSEFISDVSCNEVGVLLLESYRDLLFPVFVISDTVSSFQIELQYLFD